MKVLLIATEIFCIVKIFGYIFPKTSFLRILLIVIGWSISIFGIVLGFKLLVATGFGSFPILCFVCGIPLSMFFTKELSDMIQRERG